MPVRPRPWRSPSVSCCVEGDQAQARMTSPARPPDFEYAIADRLKTGFHCFWQSPSWSAYSPTSLGGLIIRCRPPRSLRPIGLAGADGLSEPASRPFRPDPACLPDFGRKGAQCLVGVRIEIEMPTIRVAGIPLTRRAERTSSNSRTYFLKIGTNPGFCRLSRQRPCPLR